MGRAARNHPLLKTAEQGPPRSPPPPYRVADLAAALGLTVHAFYRARPRLHRVEGLPQPLDSARPLRWSRAAVDAWLDPRTRHLVIANDAAASAPAVTLEQRRARLSKIYGGY